MERFAIHSHRFVMYLYYNVLVHCQLHTDIYTMEISAALFHGVPTSVGEALDW